MAHPMTVTIGVQSFAVFAAEREREREKETRETGKKNSARQRGLREYTCLDTNAPNGMESLNNEFAISCWS